MKPRILARATAFSLSTLMVFTGLALAADDVVMDPDGLTPFAEDSSAPSRNLGDVCLDTPAGGQVLLKAKKGSGQVWTNGASLTITSGGATGPNASDVSIGAGADSTILLESDWNSQAANFLSGDSAVGTFSVTSAALGAHSANAAWDATGTGTAGTQSTPNLHVEWNVIDCTPSDGTAPTGSIVINDAATWTNNASVTVDLSGSDAVGVSRYRLATSQGALDSASDVAVSPAETSFSRNDLAFSLSAGDGSAKQAWLRLCDAADNCADFSDTIGLDTVKPTIIGSTTPYVPGTWTNQDVVVTFTCTDNAGGSDIATDTVDGSTVSTEGADQSVSNTGTCVDNAGNVADTATVNNIDIDKTAPVITNNGPTPASPNGSNGWYVSALSTNFSASDGSGSGLDATCAAAFPKNVSTETAEGNTVTVSSGPCTDLAGNTNPGISSDPYMIDLSDPTVTLTTPPDGATYVLNEVVNADFECDDTISGLASCVGTVADGALIDTSTVGSHSFQVVATDNAGRTKTVTHTYNVEYSEGTCADGTPSLQILQPINFTGNQSGFKKGSTIPAKFMACDADGNPIGTAGLVTEFKRIGSHAGSEGDIVLETLPVDSTVKGSTDFRYDATSGQWIFNIDTKTNSYQANYSYYFRITLDSGQTILFDFFLKNK
jgi:hypothetical protein